MSFLFDIKNIETNILNYNLNIYDKLSLFKKIIVNNYDKIYILSPKNIYFYLPFFTKSKFYAICVKDFKRNRPYNFLKKNYIDLRSMIELTKELVIVSQI